MAQWMRLAHSHLEKHNKQRPKVHTKREHVALKNEGYSLVHGRSATAGTTQSHAGLRSSRSLAGVAIQQEDQHGVQSQSYTHLRARRSFCHGTQVHSLVKLSPGQSSRSPEPELLQNSNLDRVSHGAQRPSKPGSMQCTLQLARTANPQPFLYIPRIITLSHNNITSYKMSPCFILQISKRKQMHSQVKEKESI